jgi:hypothetical protein
MKSAKNTWFCLIVRIIYFYWAQNITYLVLKIYIMVECNITYVMVFFLIFLKYLYSNF